MKEHRESSGMTLNDLSKKLGVLENTIVSIEDNKYVPTVKLAMKISRVYDVPIEEIFVAEEEDFEIVTKKKYFLNSVVPFILFLIFSVLIARFIFKTPLFFGNDYAIILFFLTLEVATLFRKSSATFNDEKSIVSNKDYKGFLAFVCLYFFTEYLMFHKINMDVIKVLIFPVILLIGTEIFLDEK